MAAAIATPLDASFGSVRIGDTDGAGFGDGNNSCNSGQCYRATLGTPCTLPVNLDGVGVLANADFIPDLDCNGRIRVIGGFDNFDNRSSAELAGNAVTCRGCSDLGSSGSDWTDVSLSTTFCSPSFPCPGIPDGDSAAPNEPQFSFDFYVVAEDIDSNEPVFFNVVFGDYDIVPATITVTPASGPAQTVNLDLQPGGLDGLIQAVSQELPFNDVFTSFAGGWRGQVQVQVDGPSEPYLVVDYVEIGPRPIDDCNDNGVSDNHDIRDGTSADWNADGVPDECCDRVRVSQESSPGAGDFDDNVLGCIDAYATSETIAGYYGYNGADFTGPAPALVADRAHLFVIDGQDGVGLAQVYDRPDSSGGRAEMQFDVFGDPDGAMLAMTDGEPSTGDNYVATAGTSFASQHHWSTFTDGIMLGDLGGPWSIEAQFAPFVPSVDVIDGLASWVAYSADGSTIPLALQEGRRVRLDCCNECTPPPVAMAGWWPLDETPGFASTAADLARVNNGVHVGALTRTDDFVHGSLVFVDDSTYVFVHDPVDGALDLGTGDFSIDAWIRADSTAPTVQGIVDKTSVELPDWLWGYSFYLRGDRLALSLADNTPPTAAVPPVEFLSDPAPILGNGNWHLVAVTVDRDAANGVRFYVDGMRVDDDLQDPTVIPGSLSTANANSGSAGAWPLTIGRTGHFLTNDNPFEGSIDEVEVIPYILSPGQIGEIYDAGPDGKCKSGCAVSSRARCCGPAAEITVTLCNDGTVPRMMSWGPGVCPEIDNSVPRLDPVAWPASGDPIYGPYSVGPGQCESFPVPLDCATVGTTHPWLFGVDVYSNNPYDPADPALDLTCRRCGVLNNDPLQAWGRPVFGVLSGEPGDALSVMFELTNPGPAATFDYAILADPGNENAADVVSLETLPPGTALTGSIFIGSGNTLPVSASVQFTEHDPGAIHEVRLQVDVDGQPGFEPIASALIRSNAPNVQDLAQAGGLGASLRVSRETDGDLTLDWAASCSSTGTDFVIYEGALGGTFTSHAPVSCTTGGATSLTFDPGSGSTYYLAAARTGTREGSIGADSEGNPRPPSSQACLPQEPPSCP